MIQITGDISIGLEELTFKVSRSSGPGGQNVNKLNTRVTVLFKPWDSPNLSDSQKKRIVQVLASRVDKEGVLQISSQVFRTQKANRKAALETLQRLLSDVLQPRRVRRKTCVPYRAVQNRLVRKKHRSQLKQQRGQRHLGSEF